MESWRARGLEEERRESVCGGGSYGVSRSGDLWLLMMSEIEMEHA